MAEMTKEQEAAYKEMDQLLKKEKWHMLVGMIVLAAMVWATVEYDVVTKTRVAGAKMVAKTQALGTEAVTAVKAMVNK